MLNNKSLNLYSESKSEAVEAKIQSVSRKSCPKLGFIEQDMDYKFFISYIAMVNAGQNETTHKLHGLEKEFNSHIKLFTKPSEMRSDTREDTCSSYTCSYAALSSPLFLISLIPA
ncbi:hypothetical protein ACTXT7_001948 [Hymenolepis weldensis]